jgi:quinoprotein glucose dehydrogenase
MQKFFVSFLIILCISCNENKDWNVYGGSYERTQYVDSDKINKNNISQLDKVWEYKTFDNDKNSQIQTNPLIIDGKFYGVSPKLKLFSLDAKSGSEIWVLILFRMI